jgi:hypothetical protein
VQAIPPVRGHRGRPARLHGFKRLRTRYEHRAGTHLGLLQPACAIICYRQLETTL